MGIVVLAGCASSSVTVVRDDTFAIIQNNLTGLHAVCKGAAAAPKFQSGDIALLDCGLSAINYPVEFYSAGASQEISRILHEELQKKYGSTLKDYDGGHVRFQKAGAR